MTAGDAGTLGRLRAASIAERIAIVRDEIIRIVQAWLRAGEQHQTVDPSLQFSELGLSHAMFRTGFREVDGELHQYVLAREEAPRRDCELVDRSASAEVMQPDDAIRAAIADLVARGFDTSRGPLVHARLVRLTPEDHALVLVIHHIATDAQSDNALVRQIWDGYLAEVAGRPCADAPELQVHRLRRCVAARADIAGGTSAHCVVAGQAARRTQLLDDYVAILDTLA